MCPGSSLTTPDGITSTMVFISRSGHYISCERVEAIEKSCLTQHPIKQHILLSQIVLFLGNNGNCKLLEIVAATRPAGNI